MYHGQQYLTDGQNAALTVAAHMLTERCLADIQRLACGEPLEEMETVLADEEVLPPRFRTLYDIAFAQKLLAVLMTVAWKLVARKNQAPACVAEEMMLSAVIDEADYVHNDVWGLPEEELGDEEPERILLEQLGDYVFEDLDFQWLWDHAADGIQDSDVGRMLGMGNLNVSEWFKPFIRRGNVHPFAAWPPGLDWTEGPPALDLDGSSQAREEPD